MELRIRKENYVVATAERTTDNFKVVSEYFPQYKRLWCFGLFHTWENFKYNSNWDGRSLKFRFITQERADKFIEEAEKILKGNPSWKPWHSTQRVGVEFLTQDKS